jgi:signal transduction histidine kinase
MALTTLRVLFIEDSVADVALLERQLLLGGYAVTARRVDTSADLLDALRAAWDLIIADFRLPGWSGLEALRLVNATAPDVPFLVVSGAISEEQAVATMKAGAQDYLFKGNLQRLVPVVERELREAAARTARRRAQAEEAARERIYQEQLRSLAAQLTMVEEAERRQIAMALHDQISQSLAIARLWMDALLPQTPPTLVPRLTDIRNLVSDAYRDVKTLTVELSPPILYDLGLWAALEWLTDDMRARYRLDVTVTVAESLAATPPLPLEWRVLLFRCIRELLLNVVKHAQASHAWIIAEETPAGVRVVVDDDGMGCPLSMGEPGSPGGFGLFSIRERLSSLGGRMTLAPRTPAGLRVCLEAPLVEGAEETTV